MHRPLLIVAVALLAGCGGGKSDEAQVRETVTAFGQATARKDYARLCDELLAPKLLDSLEEIGLPCRVAMERSLGEVEEPRLVVGEVKVDGDEATAAVRSSAKGQDPSRDTVSLVRVDDRWRIADLGSGQGSAPEPSATP